jgi:hypothetical protein
MLESTYTLCFVPPGAARFAHTKGSRASAGAHEREIFPRLKPSGRHRTVRNRILPYHKTWAGLLCSGSRRASARRVSYEGPGPSHCRTKICSDQRNWRVAGLRFTNTEGTESDPIDCCSPPCRHTKLTAQDVTPLRISLQLSISGRVYSHSLHHTVTVS